MSFLVARIEADTAWSDVGEVRLCLRFTYSLKIRPLATCGHIIKREHAIMLVSFGGQYEHG